MDTRDGALAYINPISHDLVSEMNPLLGVLYRRLSMRQKATCSKRISECRQNPPSVEMELYGTRSEITLLL